MRRITAADSQDVASGNAFEALAIVPDSLIVDADAFLISESSGNGAELWRCSRSNSKKAIRW